MSRAIDRKISRDELAQAKAISAHYGKPYRTLRMATDFLTIERQVESGVMTEENKSWPIDVKISYRAAK